MSQVGSTCYSTDAAGLGAIASAEVGKVVSAGSVVYVVDAAPSGASSIAYTLNPVGGGTPLVSTVSVVIQPCQLLDWADGVELGWLVGAAWIATFAVLQLRKAVHE